MDKVYKVRSTLYINFANVFYTLNGTTNFNSIGSIVLKIQIITWKFQTGIKLFESKCKVKIN